jgi:hypothetical protein
MTNPLVTAGVRILSGAMNEIMGASATRALWSGIGQDSQARSSRSTNDYRRVCTMMLRETYEQTGGFSPLFRVYGVEDIDLSMRAWITGLGVKCVTGARVGHQYRSTFPYHVNFDHIEFNQLVMVRTVFEEATVRVLEEPFKPIPAQVAESFEQVNWLSWRATVQANRKISDTDFIRRFLPTVPTGALLAEPALMSSHESLQPANLV